MKSKCRDLFLGGRLAIWQPVKGYRAGVDPVFLAAAVPAMPGQSVLELGCGVGVASLALQARVGGLDITGLEMQADYADLARKNVAENGLEMQVVTGDLTRMPPELRARRFDHVIANPPYYRRNGGSAANDSGREAALAEVVPLAAWIDAATRRLAPKGTLSLIQRADRLPDLLAACDHRLGDLRVLPLTARQGRAAGLILLRARKGAGGGFALLPPVVLHDGARHDRDGESYRPEISAILREGRAFDVDWQ